MVGWFPKGSIYPGLYTFRSSIRDKEVVTDFLLTLTNQLKKSMVRREMVYFLFFSCALIFSGGSGVLRRLLMFIPDGRPSQILSGHHRE